MEGLTSIVILALNIFIVLRIYWWIVVRLMKLKELNIMQPSRVLITVATILAMGISFIIFTFGLSYFMINNYGFRENYIISASDSVPLTKLDMHLFLYFSAATYFSLGYGDFVPSGNIMYLLVFLQTLLGYVTSGLILAYAFDIFIKTTKP
ncbi:hypothetical protein GGQ84_002066 [Desulfitispora alkaliphila]|uniref:hypothetical protein n=1 Tax=Desulfitispora alkaliphila TaxID=622674 RepID=UPI003D205FAE